MSLYFKNKGFTLIELLVSIGIMLTILTVIIFNQKSYNEVVSLSNLVDNVALSLSQAQAYGIAIREREVGSSDFSSPYGVAFNIYYNQGSQYNGSPTSYIFFSDRNGDGYYNSLWPCPLGGTSECLEKVEISGGNRIDSFCWVKVNGTDQCSSISRADITFKRPNPEARIRLFNSGGGDFETSNNMKGVRIIFKSPSGLTRSIVVYTSGQISAQ